MSDPKEHQTRSGRTFTDKDIDAIARVEETDYDVEALKTRRRGRPPMGSGPADVVPVRIDPELSRAGELESIPDGIAEPYRLMLQGDVELAVAKWRELDAPYEVALTLTGGSHSEQLEALEILEELGAVAVAARFRQQMRQAGQSVPRGKSREARANPAGLTARQAEVLELVAEGLTNTEIADQLFLSLRTVENHVSAVLSKLGASSREEASAIGRESGLVSVQTKFGDQSRVSRSSPTEVKR